MSSSDEDPFSFTPSIRKYKSGGDIHAQSQPTYSQLNNHKKKISPSSKCSHSANSQLNKSKRKLPQVAQSSQTKSRRRSTPVKIGSQKRKSKSPINMDNKLWCPNCQLPLDIFVREYNTPMEKHTNICLVKTLEGLPDCTFGLNCKEYKEKHFWLFSHDLLAKLRSFTNSPSDNNKTKKTSKLCIDSSSDDDDNSRYSLNKSSNYHKKESHNNGTAGDLSENPISTSNHNSQKENSNIDTNSKNRDNINNKRQHSKSSFLKEASQNSMSSDFFANLEDLDKNTYVESCLGNKTCFYNVNEDSSNDNFSKSEVSFANVLQDDCSKTSNRSSNAHMEDVNNASSKNNQKTSFGEFLSGQKVSQKDKINQNEDTVLSGGDWDQQTSKNLVQNQDSRVESDEDLFGEIEEGNHSNPTPVIEKQNNIIDNDNSNKEDTHIHLHFNQNYTQKLMKKSIMDYFGAKKSTKSSQNSDLHMLKDEIHVQDELNNLKEVNKNSKKAWSAIFKEPTKKADTNLPIIDPKIFNEDISNTNVKGVKKKCPFYKRIPDTEIAVDAFNYGVVDGIKAYFLSHFHYDHYQGLSKNWIKPIFCSQITANLIKLKIKVNINLINVLPMDEPRVICGTEVTLLEANHCPGAVMFLFKLVTGKVILHVGDFRAHPKHESIPSLWNSDIHTLYLDTTYCSPKYSFPSQEDIIDSCVGIIQKHVLDHPKLLVVVGSYSIGKERVFKAIASCLDCFIWADPNKRRILNCLDDEEISKRLTADQMKAQIHVLPMNKINYEFLSNHLKCMSSKYSHMVALKPTGWSYSGNNTESFDMKHRENIYIYGIPYSEHSSYSELKRFVQFIEPKQIIPTVNMYNVQERNRMQRDFAQWLKNTPIKVNKKNSG